MPDLMSTSSKPILTMSDLSQLMNSHASTALINTILATANASTPPPVDKPLPRPFHIDWFRFESDSDADMLLSTAKNIMSEFNMDIIPASDQCNQYSLTCIGYSGPTSFVFEINIFSNPSSYEHTCVLELPYRDGNKTLCGEARVKILDAFRSRVHYVDAPTPLPRPLKRSLDCVDSTSVTVEPESKRPHVSSVQSASSSTILSTKSALPVVEIDRVAIMNKALDNAFRALAPTNFVLAHQFIEAWRTISYSASVHSRVDVGIVAEAFMSRGGVDSMMNALRAIPSHFRMEQIDQVNMSVLSTVEYLMSSAAFLTSMVASGFVDVLCSMIQRSFENSALQFQSTPVRRLCVDIFSRLLTEQPQVLTTKCPNVRPTLSMMVEKGDEHARQVALIFNN